MKFSNIDLKNLACYIYETLKKAKIDVVLVGGASFLSLTKAKQLAFFSFNLKQIA